MAIDTLELDRPQRKRVAWLAIQPPAEGEAAFKERGFQVQQYSAAQLQDQAFLMPLAAVIFTQREADLTGITQELQTHAQRLLDYDCRIIIRAFDRGDLHRQPLRIIANAVNRLRLWTVGLPPGEAVKLKMWQPTGHGEPPLPHARLYGLNVKWPDIANFITEHQPGPAPNANLVIVPDVEKGRLRPGHEVLLRRAFWDCTEVHLKPMDDGRSGVSVYCAHAELAEGQLGRWPLPYFVKIGERSKVFNEYLNYQDKVDPYIAFHLGPHLIRERCCLGANTGVIVGDFVDESESLIECARAGRAAPAIACLFDRTLVGWHRSARKEREESCKLANGFRRIFPEMIGAFEPRLAQARALGAKKSLSELQALFECCTSTPVLVGPIHGDMHAANVRVRATDAILIDFLAHKRGPLVYDAAVLEASLLVEGFRDGREFDRASMSPERIAKMDSEIKEWLRSIETLYTDIPLQDALSHPNPKNASCWFHACVRQIRRYAREMQTGEHQYAAALALALLIKASKDLEAPEPEASRRAGAYVLGERVLVNTFGPKEAIS